MADTTPAGYEQKFEDFIKLCAKAKTEDVSEVLVAAPWVIGDTYDELIESLSRLADAGLASTSPSGNFFLSR
jgi:dihydrodipicolinate synthase/N-acetylneuraminate lyase